MSVRITRRSSFSGKVRTLGLNITEEQLQQWQEGTPIQKAAPQLSAGDREFIISGVTEEEWNELYPPEEDENDSTF